MVNGMASGLLLKKLGEEGATPQVETLPEGTCKSHETQIFHLQNHGRTPGDPSAPSDTS